MFSPHHCSCGCGDNVQSQGAYVPGHENTKTAREYREWKTRRLEEIRQEKAAQRELPPDFGRGAGQDVFPAQHVPVRAPFFGRKDNAK